MTKYFLHGGNSGALSEDNKLFYQTIVKSFSGTINLLCVYFAKEDVKPWDWNAMFEFDKKQITETCVGSEINFVQADAKIEVFIEQIKQAQIIFLKGGKTPALLKILKSIPDIEKIWLDKVVVGCSAGALVLSKYYYDGDFDSCNEGLGILPIKLICHWGEKRVSKKEVLESFGENLEIYTIPEEKFISMEK